MDEHLTTYENPFKFSGKELDDITGLYDHGARSRNPISTLRYGVDPLFEKYPDFSPYNYCEGNPIKMVDPDGMNSVIKVGDSTITISANIILKGQYARSPGLAAKYKEQIMNTWGSFTEYNYKGKKYSVIWNINVRPIKEGEYENTDNALNNYITPFDKVTEKTNSTRSYVEGTCKGEWDASWWGDANPAAHEFGHILGLRDRYVTDKKAIEYGAKKSSPYIHWEGNIMAEGAGKGKVDIRNIDQLLLPALQHHNDRFF